MLSAFRATLAAAAIAVIGLSAGAASAKPAQVVGPNKLSLKLCYAHYETKVQYVGIKKIGYRYYRVYRITKIYVDRRCHKHVISVSYRYVPLPWFFHKKAAPSA